MLFFLLLLHYTLKDSATRKRKNHGTDNLQTKKSKDRFIKQERKESNGCNERKIIKRKWKEIICVMLFSFSLRRGKMLNFTLLFVWKENLKRRKWYYIQKIVLSCSKLRKGWKKRGHSLIKFFIHLFKTQTICL